jgi:hypothetical protein
MVLCLSVFAHAPGTAAQATSGSASVKCDAAIAGAAELSGIDLFAAIPDCAESGRNRDINFLVIAGQLKAMTDLTILTPADEKANMAAGALYGQLYYQFGGLGFDEVYRSPTDVDWLEHQLRNATPTFSGTYNPGWSYKQSAKIDIYDAFYRRQLEERIWQMRNHALLIQNDDYFAIQQEMNDLLRDNRILVQGSAAEAKHAELSKTLGETAKHIAQLPPPRLDASFVDRLNEQEPDMAALQVATGYNGPASGGVDVFPSETEVRASWLASALSADQLEAMLDRTDFSSQVLIAYRFGEYQNASGKVVLADLSYDSGMPGYDISVRIGVVPQGCDLPSAASYPFLVGQAPAVAGAEVRGRSMSNFDGGCVPIVSADPVALP